MEEVVCMFIEEGMIIEGFGAWRVWGGRGTNTLDHLFIIFLFIYLFISFWLFIFFYSI